MTKSYWLHPIDYIILTPFQHLFQPLQLTTSKIKLQCVLDNFPPTTIYQLSFDYYYILTTSYWLHIIAREKEEDKKEEKIQNQGDFVKAYLDI